tara:strand:+ start:537 stop:749 length:213 start_codon:yes stop_codon:yes gene_type:complete
MKYILKSNQRFANGFFVKEIYFYQICDMFKDNAGEAEVDRMIEEVSSLNVGESFNIDFFGGNSYFFKRIS